MFNPFKKKPTAARTSISAYARLNAKVMPIDRGERFEDPLQEVLAKSRCAEVTGGGTAQKESGEVDYCGIDIDIFDPDAAVPLVCTTLTKLG
ncbi:MAG TPA: hypothetical protein VFF65_03705, partial [Phycisphaerales bacterium]|nr:hypothetical protein [Phycisphaerales bacterium]